MTKDEFIKSMGKQFIYILTEMCNRVKCKNIKSVLKKDGDKFNWLYNKYEWTQDEENDYRKWLEHYLYTNKEAKKELTYIKDKEYIKNAVSMFLLNYSWKYKK